MLPKAISYLARGAAALALGALVLEVNVDVGCQRDIMNVLLPCREPSRDSLLERIAQGPADIWAYKDYALSAKEPERSQLVLTAASIYPQEPNLQWASAVIAANKGDAAKAVGLLVNIVEHTGDAAATDALAKLVVAGGTDLLMPHLNAGSTWADRLSSHLPSVPGALRAGVPFIAEATRKGAIPRERALHLISAFKSQSAYIEGFTLWAQLQEAPVPLLRNGDFSEPLNTAPFDWETQAGAKTGVAARIFRGDAIPFAELALDGKPVATPMLRQFVFASPGKYRFEGQYSERLRSYEPPAWIVRCLQPDLRIALIPLPPSPDWRTFSAVLQVPEQCRSLVALEATFENANAATVAGTGTLAFRGIRLTVVD